MFSQSVIAVMVAEMCALLSAQTIPYGSNDHAGHYVQTPDAKIYYEQYGDGSRPLVLLHGGVYGYIDEFGRLIGELSKNRTVIAIATRGSMWPVT